MVRKQNLFDSPKVEQVNLYETLRVGVQDGDEDKFESSFKPIVAQLEDPDTAGRAEAAAAITKLAPHFLEETRIATGGLCV